MLADLRAINKIIQPMGSLWPGIPLPSLLPKDWPSVVSDLQGCCLLFLYKNKIEKNVLLQFLL